ncbi:hypothetical protein ABPG74_006666 [Tetrahymena malaccensis]
MSKQELRLQLQQLQQSYITLCLKTSKAHFQIREFLNIQNNKDNSDIISNQQLGHVKVYDQVENKCKMLIICLSIDFEKYNQFYHEVTKKCIRTDIYLKIVDQYFLDADKMFYVFETECFSSTLTEFKDQFQLESGIIKEIRDSLEKFCQKKVHIFYNKQEKLIQQYYVILNDKITLQVKFNLIDPNWEIESYLQNEMQLGYLKENSSKENTILGQKQTENKMVCEKQEEKEEIIYSNNEILQMFQEFYFKKSIQKNNLLKVVQQKYENILKYHSIEMIEIISNHPLYDNFKVVYSNEHKLELKTKKRGQLIILQAHCFQNLQKAQETLSIYNKILSNKKINSTIFEVELFVFEKQSYILVEKKYFNHIQKSDYNISQMVYNEFKVINFINFTYQLLVFSELQITKVNPLNLLALENEISENLYCDIVEKYEEGLQYLKTESIYQEQLDVAKQIFEKIDRKEIVEKITLSSQNFNDKEQSQYAQESCELEEEEGLNLQDNKYLKEMKSPTTPFEHLHEEIAQSVQEIVDDPKYMDYTIDEVSLNNFSTQYIEMINTILEDTKDFRFKLEEQCYEKSLFKDLIKQFFEKIAENLIESVKVIYEKIKMGFSNYILMAIIELSVQISCITFDHNQMKRIPKLTPFYKLKRLVSVCLKYTTLEDGRDVDETSFISNKEAFETAIYEYIN